MRRSFVSLRPGQSGDLGSLPAESGIGDAEVHTIMTYTEIGALTGFLTFLFTVFDRFMGGRPIASVGRDPDSNKQFRDLVCSNLSRHDVVLTSVTSWPNWAQVKKDDTVKEAVRSAMGDSFTAVLAPGEVKRFPLVLRRGELLDAECTETGLFLILIYWRKTRSAWLPQVPAFVVSSAKTLRQLASS